MKNYYLFSSKQTKGSVASAFAPENTKLAQDLIPDLEGSTTLPFDLELKKLSEGEVGLAESVDLSGLKNVWLDYQPNSLAWPMFSGRLKAVFEEHLTCNEYLDWINAKVNGGGKSRTYYVPRFARFLDVLDIENTTFVPGTTQVIRPSFARSKILDYAVFPKPSAHGLWAITSALYIREDLKIAIQTQNLSGVDFEKARVS